LLQKVMPRFMQVAFRHIPLTQRGFWPFWHIIPHAPQLSMSCLRSTQAPLHEVSGDRQVQAPPAQVWSGAHEVSQLPHADGVSWSVVHRPPPGHAVAAHWQAPPWQVSPWGQVTPQPPQLSTSESTGVQAPLHIIVPAGQEHEPPSQAVLAGQACPQVPQLPSLVWRSTQPMSAQ
jgi:hypothetical protein